MKILTVTALMIVGLGACPLQARDAHAGHHFRTKAFHPMARGGAMSSTQPVQAATLSDFGQGALAPNGYRGPGTATGGPAGGLTTSGP